jgi:two-component system, cell cycle sensor histidine kinase and response regulator CckA
VVEKEARGVSTTIKKLLQENETLKNRLEEAEETLRAIQQGEVDALVINGPEGEQVFTLKGAEYPYRVFFEEMNEGAVTLTRTGIIGYSNRSFSRMIGIPLEKIIGTEFYSYISGEYRAIFDNMLQECARNQQGFGEGRIDITSQGLNVPIHLSCKSGEIAGIPSIFLIITNLTEQINFETTLKKQAELLDKAHDAITVRDLNNRIIYCNKGSERMYGWKSAEVVGKIANDVFFKEPYPQPREVEALKDVTDNGEWNGEMYHVAREGKHIIVDSRWTLLRDDEGNPESILVINTDITEKKDLMAQFHRAQRLESIGTLASGIAHDMNNILSPVLLSVDLFKTKLGDDESFKLLEILETNIKRGADLTKQILSFARGVEGERQLVQIARLITELETTIKATFPKSIQISTKIPDDLWTIFGDLTQIHQVLMNLCVNARDAMPHGGLLRIEAENLFIDDNYVQMNIEAKPGPHVAISVIDTGTGMTPDVMDRIFEPFFTTKKQGEGTGLGLSTARGIVKSHGGFIHVYSEVDQGSTFKIHLPSSSMSEEATKEQTRLETFQGRGELILIVDDEEMIRIITAKILEQHGYTTITAANGADAITIYSQRKDEVKLVILDMMMPVMDGNACIRKIREIDEIVKIIGVSGLGQIGIHPDVIKTTSDFLMKPYTAEKLTQTVHSILAS